MRTFARKGEHIACSHEKQLTCSYHADLTIKSMQILPRSRQMRMAFALRTRIKFQTDDFQSTDALGQMIMHTHRTASLHMHGNIGGGDQA